MRLLIVTQAVDKNDPVLGFFHAWIEAFASNVERVEVICLREGVYSLPENVRVHSLGKERGNRSAFSYAVAFARLAWKLRNEYDCVFVHMNPEYLIIAGPLWRMLGKRTALWYMHKKVSWRLRLGIIFADVVFTASPQSMRIATRKKRVVGHGIRIGELQAAPAYPPLTLLTVGRLSRVKRIHILIDAVAALVADGTDARLMIAGAAAGADGERYEKELRDQAEVLGIAEHLEFLGPQPHDSLPQLFSQAHLFLHASATGSLDKASLEPLAAGVPVITVDEELARAGIRNIILSAPDAESFAQAIREASEARLWDDRSVREGAHAFVRENHELARLIPRILAEPSFTVHR